MIRPWDEKPKEYYVYNKVWNEKQNCIIEIVSDKNCHHKRGDIVKMNPGYYESYEWKGWFMTESDKEKYLIRNVNIPKDLANQFAIIMTRYKRTKKAIYVKQKYRDYGSYILFLTGKPGKLRKFFGSTRYNIIDQFPYDIKSLPKEVLKLFKDFGIINLPKKLCNQYNKDIAKIKFLETLQDLLHGENNG